MIVVIYFILFSISIYLNIFEILNRKHTLQINYCAKLFLILFLNQKNFLSIINILYQSLNKSKNPTITIFGIYMVIVLISLLIQISKIKRENSKYIENFLV